MQSEPIDPATATPLEGYVPAELERQRHDGWTEQRQTTFLIALSETGCVTDAARAAGITARSAYRLRAHPNGNAFGAAWDQALRLATGNLLAAAYERALRGTPTEYWRGGKLVGETRAPSDRLLIYLLKTLNPYPASHSRWRQLEVTADKARDAFDDSLDVLPDVDVPADPESDADIPLPSPDGNDPLLPAAA